jgi:hypothetical protein
VDAGTILRLYNADLFDLEMLAVVDGVTKELRENHEQQDGGDNAKDV